MRERGVKERVHLALIPGGRYGRRPPTVPEPAPKMQRGVAYFHAATGSTPRWSDAAPREFYWPIFLSPTPKDVWRW